MLDVRVKMNDNGLWKEGYIIDYGEPEEYSESMKEKFLILTVPDSWKGRLQAAVREVVSLISLH